MRIEPALPVQMVKTYGIDVPLATHWRKASCAEVECKAHTEGWITLIPEDPDIRPREAPSDPTLTVATFRRLESDINRIEEARAYYIRHLSGREFTEHRDETGYTVFDFTAGQECFAPHKVRIDRPEIFVVRGGDHRGNPTRETKVHDRSEDWVEDFAYHQDAIATRIERG